MHPTGWRWPSGSAPRPINIADGDPAEQILDATGGIGADRGIEAVGYQAHDPAGDEHPEMVLDSLVQAVRTTGGIGVVGVYVPEDPQAADRGRAARPDRLRLRHLLPEGAADGHRPVPGQAVQQQLRDLIIAGRATPSLLVSHELRWTRRPTPTSKFDKRADGYTKVLLHP